MPALAVSVALNIVTGGAVISNYFNDPTSRNDVLSEPYQVKGKKFYYDTLYL